RFSRDWSSDVCSSDLVFVKDQLAEESGIPGTGGRRRAFGRRFERGYPHHLSRREPHVGPDATAVDAHLPAAQELLQMAEGDLRSSEERRVGTEGRARR